MPAQDAQQLELDFLPHLPVVVHSHRGQITSDAGLLPIAQFDRRWNYTARMARRLDEGPPEDPRQKHRKPLTRHQRQEMLRQRFFGILAGYEDCNDHDTLRSDPVFKMIADRLPEGRNLASQPTLSRFENAVTVASLYRLNEFLVATGIERLKQKHGGELPASLTIDLDATDDPTHGQQQLTLFHGYFGQYQYFPLVLSEPTTKHVFGVWLRPGTAHAALGADDDLMRLVDALRKERPDIALHVRGDAGFGVPWMYDVCEKNGLTYTFGFPTNARLKKLTDALVQTAVDEYGRTHVIKVAATIVQTTRRVVVRLAANWPWWPIYQSVAHRAVNFSTLLCGP